MKTYCRRSVRTFVRVASLACLSLALACSSDLKGGGGSHGGFGPHDAGAGGKSSGGRGGNSTGGTAGAGASAGNATGGAITPGGNTVEAGVKDAMVIDGGPPPDDVFCARGADAPRSVLLVAGVATCNGCISPLGEVAAVDLTNGCVVERRHFSGTHAIVRTGVGLGFVLEDTTLHAYDLQMRETTVPLAFSEDGGAALFASDLVHVRAVGGSSKAYVPVSPFPYGNSTSPGPNVMWIAVVDLDEQRITSLIDMSPVRRPGERVGQPFVSTGFYDAVTGRVYFSLTRSIDGCPPRTPSTLVAIDTTTDQLVDLNGAAAGLALSLPLSPDGVATDPSSRRAFFPASGCREVLDSGADLLILDGIESVNLDTLATGIFPREITNGQQITDVLVLAPDSVLLLAPNGGNPSWWKWKPSSPMIGERIFGLPEKPVVEGPDSLVGLSSVDLFNWRVVRYKVSTQVATDVVSSVLRTEYGEVGLALVR